jgi:dnd system-associated protein 4
MGSEKVYLAYDSNFKDTFDKLKTHPSSPFKGREYADIFLFAIAFAIRNQLPPSKIKGKKNPNIPLSAFGKNEWLLNAIAIAEYKDHNILNSPEKIHSLAEEYANAGLDELSKFILERSGDFFSKIELDIKNEKESPEPKTKKRKKD